MQRFFLKAVIKSDLILHVQDALEVNFEMLLGSASESVTERLQNKVSQSQNPAK